MAAKKVSVIECDLKDDTVPARFVAVTDWSSDRQYAIRIDPRDDKLNNPLEALAWTFPSEDEEGYKWVEET